MNIQSFRAMEALQDEFSRSCNALLARHQELMIEILGRPGSKRESHRNPDLRFKRIDAASELPEFIHEEWEYLSQYERATATWEHRMKYSDIYYECYLGYESEYDTCTLPLSWLFDSNWEHSARIQLQADADRIRKHQARNTEAQRQKDILLLKHLQEKYGGGTNMKVLPSEQ